MLHYDRISISKGTDVNKTRERKQCDICHYLHFPDKGFKFQTDVFNGCHDVLMMPMNLNNIAILNIYGDDYRCIMGGISKREVVNLLENIDLNENRRTL